MADPTCCGELMEIITEYDHDNDRYLYRCSHNSDHTRSFETSLVIQSEGDLYQDAVKAFAHMVPSWIDCAVWIASEDVERFLLDLGTHSLLGRPVYGRGWCPEALEDGDLLAFIETEGRGIFIKTKHGLNLYSHIRVRGS